MVRHDLRLSLEINFDASDLQVLPEASGRDLRYLDQLLDALAELVRDTSWPESRQGEFLGYVTRDVYEFGCAIRSEAAADRWTVAASLIRPLQERSEYAVAAAVDPGFAERYVEYIIAVTDTNFTRQLKQPLNDAREVLCQWEGKYHGDDRLLKTSKRLYSIGSIILHNAIGLSGEAEEIAKARPGLLRMASGRVQCAVANVMLATKVMGKDNTKAWQRCVPIVTVS